MIIQYQSKNSRQNTFKVVFVVVFIRLTDLFQYRFLNCIDIACGGFQYCNGLKCIHIVHFQRCKCLAVVDSK